MSFPVYVHLGPWQIHPHLLFETLAYFLGYRLYALLRSRQGDAISAVNRIYVLAGAIAGGALGAKCLYWLEDPVATWHGWSDPAYLMAGKSIIGGLLGGLIGVELVKQWVGERRSTGDLYAIPLAFGIAVGRIGCFLTGLADNTHGVATSLPWGVNFGDGVPRHPTQLYEIAFCGLLIAWLLWRRRLPHAAGDLFKGFMIGYLAFRVVVEFIKPYPTPYLGLTATQVAALAGLFYYRHDVARIWLVKGELGHG